MTHAQPIVGLKQGVFQKHCTGNFTFNSKLFNAGPSAIEALLAGEIDLLYVGPSPALNGYLRSEGEALKVIAGAASGGALFVARQDVQLLSREDYAGKRFASPQIGNTQDISLRTYLRTLGHEPKERGGDVEILPIANPDILSLFLRKEIHAAWVPEPWGSILVQDGHGRMVLDERDLWPGGRFATTLLVASQRVLQQQPQMVKAFLQGHVEITQWIQQNPGEAKRILNQEIATLTRKPIPDAILDSAFSRLETTWDPLFPSIQTFLQRAVGLGYSKGGDIQQLCDMSLLNEVLKEKGLPIVGLE